MAPARPYNGPPVLSAGFKLFFLGGAVWSAVAVALWVLLIAGAVEFPLAIAPVDWHTHEMLFGYLPAIVAGFLLTAVPNWTGRDPVRGVPLLLLFLLWVAGRIAMGAGAAIGPEAAALLDSAFLIALCAVVARELVAGKSTRNLKVLAGIGILVAGNALFHAETMGLLDRRDGAKVGIAGAVLLIMVIGGRIIPSFTRNWLAKHRPGRLPVPFNRTDLVVLSISLLALIGWVVFPTERLSTVFLFAAGILNLLRLVRWAGDRTSAEPLVLILHVGYLFVPAGFLLAALSQWQPAVLSESGALHGWTAGAIGVMTLAVMTRATLGHSGQPLTASRPLQLIYLSALIAVAARLAAAFFFAMTPMLYISAVAWIGAFAGYAILFGPVLLTRQ